MDFVSHLTYDQYWWSNHIPFFFLGGMQIHNLTHLWKQNCISILFILICFVLYIMQETVYISHWIWTEFYVPNDKKLSYFRINFSWYECVLLPF